MMMSRAGEASPDGSCTCCHNGEDHSDGIKPTYQAARTLLEANRDIDSNWRSQFVALATGGGG